MNHIKNIIFLLFTFKALLTFSHAIENIQYLSKHPIIKTSYASPTFYDQEKFIENKIVVLNKEEAITFWVKPEFNLATRINRSLVWITYYDNKKLVHMGHFDEGNFSRQPQESIIPFDNNIKNIGCYISRHCKDNRILCNLIFYSDLEETIYYQTIDSIVKDSNIRNFIATVSIIPTKTIGPESLQIFDLKTNEVKIVYPYVSLTSSFWKIVPEFMEKKFIFHKELPLSFLKIDNIGNHLVRVENNEDITSQENK